MNTNTPRAPPEGARAGLAPTVTARTPRGAYARPAGASKDASRNDGPGLPLPGRTTDLILYHAVPRAPCKAREGRRQRDMADLNDPTATRYASPLETARARGSLQMAGAA